MCLSHLFERRGYYFCLQVVTDGQTQFVGRHNLTWKCKHQLFVDLFVACLQKSEENGSLLNAQIQGSAILFRNSNTD